VQNGPIPTGCEPLDELLGGGFDRGTVSQVYGPPAAGKTNVALTAAVEAAASGGRALYVDTEGLSLDRFEQLAEARLEAGADAEDLDDLAARVIVTEATDFDEQREAVRDVEEFVDEIDLAVVDSLTGFYRLERAADAMEGDALRAVGDQVTHLLSLARKHDLAVVVTNQVFADPDSDRVRPLGGNTLEHWTGVVLRVDRFRGGNRRATLEKHRSKAAGDSVTFRIVDEGLVGAEDGPAPH
jgi:DNA repair protein RadB